MSLSVGLLINFGAPTLKEGLKRIVNGLDPAALPIAVGATPLSRRGDRASVGFATAPGTAIRVNRTTDGQ